MINELDILFMREALLEAEAAALDDEVPVGAVMVRNGEIIARARNRREKDKNPLSHAEIKIINDTCRALGGWRLVGCTLYVTLEPCPMCAGAIINSRIERVVFGAFDEKAGAFGTMINLTEYPLFKPQITGGVLKDECSAILSEFFKKKRKPKE
ncbi:MAG: tRNA adenosine(34) deaminase TadA [Clostridia bacterium]|nr:tRNA adenosine(34) deaminase TadA [Clostridia bacterium]MBQ8567006.1 tRNA adenosine(34) deaminase TadA [Clostridia bacterium]